MIKEKTIDQQVQDSLTEDEHIRKQFNLKGRQVYETNKRLLVQEGNTVRDLDYNHISSITYRSKRYLHLIALGISLIVWGAFMEYLFATFLIIFGLLSIIFGVHKSKWVEVNVVWVSEPQIFRGERANLDSLVQIIRERQISEHKEEPRKAEDTDFTETLRKLAELKDDGIITQEEFEEKKSKILSSDWGVIL